MPSEFQAGEGEPTMAPAPPVMSPCRPKTSGAARESRCHAARRASGGPGARREDSEVGNHESPSPTRQGGGYRDGEGRRVPVVTPEERAEAGRLSACEQAAADIIGGVKAKCARLGLQYPATHAQMADAELTGDPHVWAALRARQEAAPRPAENVGNWQQYREPRSPLTNRRRRTWNGRSRTSAPPEPRRRTIGGETDESERTAIAGLAAKLKMIARRR